MTPDMTPMTHTKKSFLAILIALGIVLVPTLDSDAKTKKRSRWTTDPLLGAIVEHESHGQPNVVGGRDGQCIGLTQICLHGFPACASGFDTPECLAVKERLLDPTENLRVARGQLQAWKKLCRRVVGHADVRGIVFGFAGADGRGIHCGMKQGKHGWVPAKTPKAVREILDLYERNLRGAR